MDLDKLILAAPLVREEVQRRMAEGQTREEAVSGVARVVRQVMQDEERKTDLRGLQ